MPSKKRYLNARKGDFLRRGIDIHAGSVLTVNIDGSISYTSQSRAERAVAANQAYWRDRKKSVIVLIDPEWKRTERRRQYGNSHRPKSRPKYNSTPFNRARLSDWRERVLLRDGYRCIWCGSEKELEADHIKEKSIFPHLAYDVFNGRTLCKKCHRFRHASHK